MYSSYVLRSDTGMVDKEFLNVFFVCGVRDIASK